MSGRVVLCGLQPNVERFWHRSLVSALTNECGLYAHINSRGIKPNLVSSAQRVRERTGVTEEMLVNHALFSNSLRGKEMKSNLKILGLALSMLPMYLHAGTGQDLKQAYQSAQAQNTQ